jgi:uncharacterized protein DUF1016
LIFLVNLKARFILISSPNDITVKVRTPSAQLKILPEKLLNSLSYSHFEQLIPFDVEIKRSFYEIECIRGNWSVRELKRQIASLYYERSGLSGNKKKLAELVQSGAEQAKPRFAVRDPYVFEFLGIKPREVMNESGLEDQLLDKLQEFRNTSLSCRRKRRSNGSGKANEGYGYRA